MKNEHAPAAIRSALGTGTLKTAAEIADATGYSLAYVRRCLSRMPDVITCGPGQNALRVYRYRIERPLV